MRLRLRRKVRKQKRHVEDITQQADNSVERLVFKRIGRLYKVRRFVVSWLALMVFIGFGAVWQVRGLDRHYLTLEPTSGGIHREGVIGNFTSVNPLFATSGVDAGVSRLIFSGLFELSPEGDLSPNLATNYSVNETGTKYTVNLRNDIVWHDGDSFNADDVIFTYETIKNPDVQSPLFSDWKDVKISKTDENTVVFSLPNTLSGFEYSLTNGLLPDHLLANVAAEDLRTNTFNTVNPVGTGPFEYSKVKVIGNDVETRQEKIILEANEVYHRGSPKINSFIIQTYSTEEDMLKAFEAKEISAMAGLHTLPDSLIGDNSVQAISTPISSAVMVFMNNSGSILSDVKVRKALVQATDTDKIRNSLGYQLLGVDSPLLRSQFAYDKDKVQFGYDLEAAKKLLDEAGWLADESGQRRKDGAPLELKLVSQSLAEYSSVTSKLQQEWAAIGIKIEAVLQPEDQIQTSAVIRHEYDLLLYGISIGQDPDVFAYWHSSQADPSLKARLNLSEYKNDTVDASLEAGRTRLDKELRIVKYRAFLDNWRKDAPAIALYQPRFLYVVRGTLHNYKTGQFEGPVDRFASVADWQIRREKVVK